ncbi:hypothetical protein [Staphylococcus phage PT1-1]
MSIAFLAFLELTRYFLLKISFKLGSLFYPIQLKYLQMTLLQTMLVYLSDLHLQQYLYQQDA